MQRASEEQCLLARHQISWGGACHCDVWWGGAVWAGSGSVDYNAMRDTEAEATEAWATGWALMPNHCWSHLSGKALETRTESHLREKGREIMHINNHVVPSPISVCSILLKNSRKQTDNSNVHFRNLLHWSDYRVFIDHWKYLLQEQFQPQGYSVLIQIIWFGLVACFYFRLIILDCINN